MAETKDNGGGAGAKSKGTKFATLLGLLMLTTVFMPTSMLLGVTMLPTLFSFLFDRSHGKSFTLTIGMLNLTAVVPSLITLWTTSHSISTANDIIADPRTWMTILGACGVGWLVFLAMPPIIKAYYEAVSASRIRTLRERQNTLRQEWGDEIAENADVALIEQRPGT